MAATDTHPLIWALSGDPQLSAAAKSVFTEADAGQAIVLISPIVTVEVIYLSEKRRISVELVDDLLAKVFAPGLSYRLAELDAAVINALRQIPRNLITDMPDRIIAATAKANSCALITRNGAITTSGLVPVIWQADFQSPIRP
ncbi:MAG TPA: PIN domain-containing protein [Blastocatellia bacterium]|nr:PIN domain-containing protein [Blastocatellia bacterium]